MISITFFNWAIGIFAIIVSALTTALVKYYADHKEAMKLDREDRKLDKEERRLYAEKLERIIEATSKERELSTIATNGLIGAVNELRQDLREWRK